MFDSPLDVDGLNNFPRPAYINGFSYKIVQPSKQLQNIHFSAELSPDTAINFLGIIVYRSVTPSKWWAMGRLALQPLTQPCFYLLYIAMYGTFTYIFYPRASHSENIICWELRVKFPWITEK